MDNRKLLNLCQALQGKTPAEVDAMLHQQRLDPQERVSVKVQLQASAAAQGRSVQAGFSVRTDQLPQDQRPRSEMDRLLGRLGLDSQRTYTEAELGELMQQAGLTAEARISVKVEAHQRGLLATMRPYANEAARLLEHLGIEGPVRLDVIEEQMDRAHWSVTAKNVVKSECQARGWLRMGSRTMHAAAEGTPLVDAQGQPRTLRSRP